MNQKLFYWLKCGDKMVGNRGRETDLNGGEDEDEWRLGVEVAGRGARRAIYIIMSIRTFSCRVQH